MKHVLRSLGVVSFCVFSVFLNAPVFAQAANTSLMERIASDSAQNPAEPIVFESADDFVRWWLRTEHEREKFAAGLIGVLPWMDRGAFVDLYGKDRREAEMAIRAAVELIQDATTMPEILALSEESLKTTKDAEQAARLRWILSVIKKTPCEGCATLDNTPPEKWGRLFNYWWVEYQATRDRAPIDRLIGVLAYFPPASQNRQEIDAALSALDMLALAARKDSAALEICRAAQDHAQNENIADLLRLVVDAAKREKKQIRKPIPMNQNKAGGSNKGTRK